MDLIKTYNVCFIGRTGNGKTSLINGLWGTKYLTDPLVACTKELYSVTVLSPVGKKYEGVTIYDTPGIGEFSSDSVYERYYQHAVKKSDCVVLVSTFDRTDAPVQRFLNRIKDYTDKRKTVKFVVALNHIDSKIITDSDGKYEPWDNASNKPTEQCMRNIQERIGIIHQRFDGKFLPFDVVPVCAMRKYGLEELKSKILNTK